MLKVNWSHEWLENDGAKVQEPVPIFRSLITKEKEERGERTEGENGCCIIPFQCCLSFKERGRRLTPRGGLVFRRRRSTSSSFE